MVEIAELTEQYMLKLPADVAAQFRPSDRFVVWVDRDTIYLKRVALPPVTEIVAEAPQGQPMSADEIHEIVHETRRKRSAGLFQRIFSRRREHK